MSLRLLPGPGIVPSPGLEPTVDAYLSVVEIAAGTGLSPDQVRRAALSGRWARPRVQTGQRGRPAFKYRMADVVVGLGLDRR